MPPTPDLSVVIPMLDAGATIDRAVESVLGGTGLRTEVLVVDDGSRDDGPRVAREISARDPRVRFFDVAERSGANDHARGAAAARNFGLDRANGRYVMFLDADDATEPTGPARLVVAAERARSSGGSPAARGAMMCCDERLEPLGRRIAIPRPLLDEGWFVRSCGMGNGAHVMDRALLGADRFDVSLPVAEDWDLWLRLAEKGAAWCDAGGGCVARYRMRPGSLTKQYRRSAESALGVLERAMSRRARGIGREPITPELVSACRRYAGLEAATRCALAGMPAAKCAEIAGKLAGAGATWTGDELASQVSWGVVHVLGAAPDRDTPEREEWLARAERLWDELADRAWVGRDGLESAWRGLAREMIGGTVVAEELVTRLCEARPRTDEVIVVGLGLNAEPIIEAAERRGLRVLGYDDRSERLRSWSDRVRAVEWAGVAGSQASVVVTPADDGALMRRLSADEIGARRWSVVSERLFARVWDTLAGRAAAQVERHHLRGRSPRREGVIACRP